MPERSCTGVSFISELVVFTVVIGRRKNCRFYDDRHDQPTLTCYDGDLSAKRIRHCKNEETQYRTVMYSQCSLYCHYHTPSARIHVLPIVGDQWLGIKRRLGRKVLCMYYTVCWTRPVC